MNRFNHPSFRFLLYLEWLLLGTALLMEGLHLFQSPSLLLRRGIEIALLGLMGLRLPVTQLVNKIGFTALEFGLILFSAVQEAGSSRSGFLLFLIVLLRSCFIFQELGRAVVMALALVSYCILLFSRPIVPTKVIAMVWEWRFSNLLLFSLTLVFALLLINALIAERQSREQLETTHDQLAGAYAQLRQYALRIENQATLQERNRIAREIHDGLGHTLAAQTIQINNAVLFWSTDRDKALSFLKQAKQLGSEALLEIRKSVSVLRSNPLKGKSLDRALSKLLQDFQEMEGVAVTHALQIPMRHDPEVNTSLYRIVQEALTNIHKHAQADTVRVELHHHAGLICLTIDDDGKGFDPAQNTTGFGLQSIRERTSALGGKVILESQPGQGCHLSVSLPFSILGS